MNLAKILLLSLIILVIPVNACKILEVYPNPYGDDNAEYVKVQCDGTCIFSDGEKSFRINKSVAYIARNSTAFKEKYGFYPDFEGIRLSNGGERIELICGNSRDEFNWNFYRDEGVIYFRTEKGWDFRYEDWSNFKPIKDHVEGKIIVTPARYILRGNGYVVSYFVSENNFEGNFEFFVDAKPVGGIPENEYLLSKKYQFHFLSSNSYRHFHYKFALSDSKVVLTTENWKWDNRGIILEFKSEKISDLLRKLIKNDLKYESAMGKIDGFLKGGEGKGRELNFKADVEVYVMPDNNPVFEFIRESKDYLLIAAPYIDFKWFKGEPLLDEIINASKRGVKIKIMLNDFEKNRNVISFLNSLPNVEAKAVKSPEFNELHAKYFVTRNKVLITSANLNKYGLKLNREIAVIIYSKDVEKFMKDAFLEDWSCKSEINPIISLTILGLVVTLSLYFIGKLKG